MVLVKLVVNNFRVKNYWVLFFNMGLSCLDILVVFMVIVWLKNVIIVVVIIIRVIKLFILIVCVDWCL